MEKSIEKIKRIKVDSLFGKKKHFNAADRHEKNHYRIGIPLIVINVVTGSVLFYVLTENADDWIKFVPLWLTLVAAILSSLQTYLNLPRRVEGHRKIANRYLSIMKKCDRLLGYVGDGLVDNATLVEKLEVLGLEAHEVNILAENFPTSNNDYKVAKSGIEAGEENYTDNELNL